MMTATEAVEAFADRLEATVDWAALHANLSAPQVMQFMQLASTAAFAAGIEQFHGQVVGEILDAAAGQAGIVGAEADFAARIAADVVDRHDTWHAAVEQARTLVGDLRRLGVLR